MYSFYQFLKCVIIVIFIIIVCFLMSIIFVISFFPPVVPPIHLLSVILHPFPQMFVYFHRNTLGFVNHLYFLSSVSSVSLILPLYLLSHFFFFLWLHAISDIHKVRWGSPLLSPVILLCIGNQLPNWCFFLDSFLHLYIFLPLSELFKSDLVLCHIHTQIHIFFKMQYHDLFIHFPLLGIQFESLMVKFNSFIFILITGKCGLISAILFWHQFIMSSLSFFLTNYFWIHQGVFVLIPSFILFSDLNRTPH